MRADTTAPGPRALPEIWEATRRRISALVSPLSDDAVSTVVPTVAGATIGDVLAHATDICTRAATDAAALCRGSFCHPLSGNLRSATLTALITTWEAAAHVISRQVESNSELASFLITDAAMCEHDLRAALDCPAARDDLAIKVALDELSGRFSDRVDAAGLPPLRVTVEQWGTIAGTGRATSCVVADRFEFVRAMSGRRSAEEIGRWNWGVDHNRYLAVISEVPLPPNEIHERDPRIPEHMRDREFVL